MKQASNRAVRPMDAPWKRMRLLAAVLALLVSSGAFAQGTSGSLPDPMSSRDLEQVMDRLELDEAQRRGVETFHEQYVADFKRLRDGEIEGFMEHMNAFQGSMPSREQMEDFIDDRERLMKRIARLDNQFFDQVTTVLGDNQQITLTRLRMGRDRERHSGDMMMMVGMLVPPALIDLSELYERLDLTPDEALMIQTSVMDYESKLTRATRELSDATMRLFLDIFDIIEAAGFTEDSFQDPEQAQEALEVMRDAWATVSASLMEKAMEISDLNRKACERISNALTADNREKLTVRYYERAYPELPSSNLRTLVRKALRYKDLTEEQWMNVSVLRDEFRRQEQNLYEDMADIRDRLRATETPFNMGGMGGMGGNVQVDDEAVDQLADLTERHEKLVERTTEALNVYIDEALQATIGEMEDPWEAAARTIAEGGDGANVDEAGNVQGAGASPMASEDGPRGDEPISVGDFRQMIVVLELDKASEAVAEQLHAAYQQRFTAVRDEVQGKVGEAQGELWSFDESTSTMRGPTEAQVHKIDELRKAAAAAMREVDAKLFRDLAVSFGADPFRQAQLDRLRNIRKRASYVMGQEMWIWGFGGQRSRVASLDLAALCLEERMLDEPNDAIAGILSSYDDEMTAAMQARFEKGLEAQRTMELQQAQQAQQRAAEGEGDEGSRIADGVRYMQSIEEMSTTLGEASKVVARINRQTVEAIMAALPEAGAAAFEKAYKHRAFPSVFRNADAIDTAIATARSLNSLSATQRDRLEALLTEFEQKHDDICDRMVEVLDSTEGAIRPFGAENAREYQRIESTIAKLEFERGELQARTRRRVQDLLSDEQLAQVGPPFVRSLRSVEGEAAGSSD